MDCEHNSVIGCSTQSSDYIRESFSLTNNCTPHIMICLGRNLPKDPINVPSVSIYSLDRIPINFELCSLMLVLGFPELVRDPLDLPLVAAH